jgi:preprotein translocase subunit SecF
VTATGPADGTPGVTRRHRFGDLYHERTNFQFVAHSRRWAVLSGVLLLASVVGLAVRQLNLGIEFEGGTAWIVEMADGREASVSDVRDLLSPLGFADSKISTLQGQGNEQVRVQAEVLEDPVQDLQDAVARAASVADAQVEFQRSADGGATFTVALAADADVEAGAVEEAIVATGHVLAADVTAEVGGEGDQRVLTVTLATLGRSPLQQVADVLAEYAGRDAEDVSISTVGPTWGERVTRKAVQAMLIFFALLAVYLSFRFEWKMAAAAIVAVLHDVVVTTGFYAIFQFEVTPATVTAFLTILGFSLYDTVVVFDKVRENQQTLIATGRSTYPEMVNVSLNAVLMRSLSTTLVALLPVVSLLVVGSLLLGATALEEFALALFAGLLVGSYSSIFVAAPLLAWWKGREPQYRALADRRRRTTLAAASVATGVPVVPPDDAPVGAPPRPVAGRAVAPRPRQARRRKRR